MKILLQQLWEQKVDWDDIVPHSTYRIASSVRKADTMMLLRQMLRDCFHSLHGFCDASEKAYAGMVDIRSIDTFGNVKISRVATKTKVTPIKKLMIPRLELCGAYLLA